MTHRSRLMRAVREHACTCTDPECARRWAEFRASVTEVACDLEESTRDTIPAPPPVYDADREEHAPSTPLTLPAPADAWWPVHINGFGSHGD